jgi:hypothetical protein
MKFGPEDNNEEPFWFAPVCLPPVNKGDPVPGANAYRDLIEEGSDILVATGDELRIEAGNVAGPTNLGVDYLVGLDPGASWDGSQVVSSYDPSPRIIKVVFYDPIIGVAGDAPGTVIVTRIGSFFLESSSGPPENTVTGRFIEIVSTGSLDLNSQSRVFGVGLIE